MKAALLIIDVQKLLCSGRDAAYDIEGVIARINTLAARARAEDIPIIFVQHEEADGPLRADSEDWQLDQRLIVRSEDIRVRKSGSDAFHGTELASLLQARGIRRLIVCGLQSEFCVDSTVRRALALGYPVELVADGHSTVDNGVLTAAQISAHHTATLANLASYGPRVTPVPAAEIRLDR